MSNLILALTSDELSELKARKKGGLSLRREMKTYNTQRAKKWLNHLSTIGKRTADREGLTAYLDSEDALLLAGFCDAKRHVRYKYGAKDINKRVDCSGFVMTAYNELFGVDLQRIFGDLGIVPNSHNIFHALKKYAIPMSEAINLPGSLFVTATMPEREAEITKMSGPSLGMAGTSNHIPYTHIGIVASKGILLETNSQKYVMYPGDITADMSENLSTIQMHGPNTPATWSKFKNDYSDRGYSAAMGIDLVKALSELSMLQGEYLAKADVSTFTDQKGIHCRTIGELSVMDFGEPSTGDKYAIIPLSEARTSFRSNPSVRQTSDGSKLRAIMTMVNRLKSRKISSLYTTSDKSDFLYYRAISRVSLASQLRADLGSIALACYGNLSRIMQNNAYSRAYVELRDTMLRVLGFEEDGVQYSYLTQDGILISANKGADNVIGCNIEWLEAIPMEDRSDLPTLFRNAKQGGGIYRVANVGDNQYKFANGVLATGVRRTVTLKKGKAHSNDLFAMLIFGLDTEYWDADYDTLGDRRIVALQLAGRLLSFVKSRTPNFKDLRTIVFNEAMTYANNAKSINADQDGLGNGKLVDDDVLKHNLKLKLNLPDCGNSTVMRSFDEPNLLLTVLGLTLNPQEFSYDISSYFEPALGATINMKDTLGGRTYALEENVTTNNLKFINYF